MAEESIPKTAFTCFRGLFEFLRLPFGLATAPAIFQRAMNKVLTGLIGSSVMVYIDDIVVYSKSVTDHARHLAEVFQRLKDVGLQLKPRTGCRTVTPPNPRVPRGALPIPPRPCHTWGIDLVGPFSRDGQSTVSVNCC